MRIADINRKVAKAGHPVTLYKGEGYLYLIWDDGEYFFDQSIYCCHFSQMAPALWLKEALGFAERCEKSIKEEEA
jgi:hypothetical protein